MNTATQAPAQEIGLPTFPIPRTDLLMPPPEYEKFRAQGPTQVKMWDGRNAWLLTRNADVRELLSSPHFSADPTKPGYPFLSPARAATVISLITLVKMRPRFASTAPFLCLMVDHLLWPLMILAPLGTQRLPLYHP